MSSFPSRKLKWDEIKEFTLRVATAIVQADPDRYTANMSKKARVGKIFIDYLRNGRGASAIVPYSTAPAKAVRFRCRSSGPS